MSGASSGPMLLVDCSQRESVLGLAVPSREGGATVIGRTFEPAAGAERERFWDELRALSADAGVAPEKIASIAVAVGPGGFTGLRVSTAFAKGVALARGVPVVPVPSARIFAASDRARGGKGPWIVALAAKGATAWVERVCDPCAAGNGGLVVDADGLAELARRIDAEGGTLLADGHLDPALAERARDAGLSVRGLGVEIGAFSEVSAAILAQGGAVAAAALQPIYAREPEAVTNWRARGSAPGR